MNKKNNRLEIIIIGILFLVVVGFWQNKGLTQQIKTLSVIKLNTKEQNRLRVAIEATSSNASYSNSYQDPNIDPNNPDNFDSMLVLSDDGGQYLKIGCFVSFVYQ